MHGGWTMGSKLIREAGGLELGRDPAAQLGKLSGWVKTLSNKDIAYGTYVFEYIAGMTGDSRIKKFAGKLGEAYARSFADWLGYAFVSRARRERNLGGPWGAKYEMLARNIENFLNNMIPTHTGSQQIIPIAVPKWLQKQMDQSAMSRISEQIYRYVTDAYERRRKTASLEDIPVKYDSALGYVISYSPEVYRKHNNELLDMGFKWQGYRRLWYSDKLTPEMLKKLPLSGEVGLASPREAPQDAFEFQSWYEDWLPRNLDKISQILNKYSAATDKKPWYFQLEFDPGYDVLVRLRSGSRDDPQTIAQAVAILRDVYTGSSGREPWVAAIDVYEKLKRVKGVAAIRLIDLANNLQHSGGFMLEHMSPDLKRWYPAFLDFKYTADVLQMVKRIKDQDLRQIAQALLPTRDQQRRLVPPSRDHRTPKGIALELMTRKDDHTRRRMIRRIREQHPKMVEQIKAVLDQHREGRRLLPVFDWPLRELPDRLGATMKRKQDRGVAMSDLRKKIIRLAHAKPELRADLLPLVAADRMEKKARRIYIESIRDASQGAKVLESLLHQIIKDLTPVMAEAVAKTFVNYVPSAVGRTILDEWRDFLSAQGNVTLKIHPGWEPQGVQTVSRTILRKFIRPLLLKMPKPTYDETGRGGGKADVRTIKEWLGYLNAGWTGGSTWNWSENAVIKKVEEVFLPWLANTVERRYEKTALHIMQQKAGKIVDALVGITRKAVTANESQIESNWAKQELALGRTADQMEKEGRILERLKQWWHGVKVLSEAELLKVMAGVMNANAPTIAETVKQSVVAEDADVVLDALKLLNKGALENSVKTVMAPSVSGALDPIVPTTNLKELLK